MIASLGKPVVSSQASFSRRKINECSNQNLLLVLVCPGKACILRCLLEVHRVFRESEPAYILNDLYVSDYCVWIQRVK